MDPGRKKRPLWQAWRSPIPYGDCLWLKVLFHCPKTNHMWHWVDRLSPHFKSCWHGTVAKWHRRLWLISCTRRDEKLDKCILLGASYYRYAETTHLFSFHRSLQQSSTYVRVPVIASWTPTLWCSEIRSKGNYVPTPCADKEEPPRVLPNIITTIYIHTYLPVFQPTLIYSYSWW